jgi:hypothetical protein
LRCDLKAEKEKSILFSSYTGVPHLIVSVAFGAAFFKMARISFNFSRASLGAESIYSITVDGFIFVIGILNLLRLLKQSYEGFVLMAGWGGP